MAALKIVDPWCHLLMYCKLTWVCKSVSSFSIETLISPCQQVLTNFGPPLARGHICGQ
jgi:hypothetical protein